MKFSFAGSISVSLAVSALALLGQDSQERLASARQVLLNYTERVRWQHYWLPATVVKSYAPGSEAQVHALFAGTAASFCAPSLEICQIYERNINGGFEFLNEWEPEANQSDASLPERFAEEYAKAKRRRPIQSPIPAKRSKGQRTFDVTKLVEPVRSQPSSEAFNNALFLTWKLLPLTPPKPIVGRTAPTNPSLLRGEVRTAVQNFRNGCGGAGRAVIPFYSAQDPRVFVYVDLGNRCEKGIFEFLSRPEGGWSFSRFVVDEIDVRPLMGRIQRARMETIALTD